MLEVTRLTFRIDKIPQGGSTLIDCDLQYPLDFAGKAQITILGDSPAGAIWPDPRPPSSFISVYVTDSGDDSTVQKIVAQSLFTFSRLLI
mgnify:CR=1 FL=1